MMIVSSQSLFKKKIEIAIDLCRSKARVAVNIRIIKFTATQNF